jgi:hypothetical protein
VKAPAIQYCLIVLSAIFTTALNDQVTFLHPCSRTPQVTVTGAAPPCIPALAARGGVGPGAGAGRDVVPRGVPRVRGPGLPG